MKNYYINREGLVKFLSELNQKVKCFIPQKTGKDDYTLVPYPCEAPKEIIFNEYRTIEPLKSYLSFAKEEVAAYFSGKEKQPSVNPICLVGVKACDLFSLKIQDFVFEQGEVCDPLYDLRRRNTLIISSDCTGFKEVCYCLAWNILPYPA